MAITLAEEVVLLSLDGASGAAGQRQAAGWAAAGGILLELVMAERVSVTGTYLELRSTAPTGVRLLDGRILMIESWLRGRSKRRVTDWLTKDHARAVGAALDGLGERGIVGSEVHKVLGVFPQRRYPQADATAERELRTGSEPWSWTAPTPTGVRPASSPCCTRPSCTGSPSRTGRPGWWRRGWGR